MVFGKRNPSFRLVFGSFWALAGCRAAGQLGKQGGVFCSLETGLIVTELAQTGTARQIVYAAVVSKTDGSHMHFSFWPPVLSNGNGAARPQFASSPRFIGNPEVAEVGTIRGMGYS